MNDPNETRRAKGDRGRLRIMMVAGEVSGDRQAACLGRAIRSLNGDVKLLGAGGDSMREAGVDIRVETPHLGCVGVLESLRFAGRWHRVFKDVTEVIRSERPHAVVLVDNEFFNTRLARFLNKQGIPAVFYFAPQVWLWGAWRARGIAKLAARILAVFPAEFEAYQRAGGRVSWVGHPLLDIVKPSGDHRRAFAEAGLDASRPTLAIMPGSRFQEVRGLAPAMVEAARHIRDRRPEVQFVLPLSDPLWRSMIDRELERFGMKDHVAVLTGEPYTILSRCKGAIVKSGTATLEMALLQVPMVAVYRLSSFSYGLGRMFVKTQFMAMPNILLGGKVVPEIRQSEVTADRLAAEGLRMLDDERYVASISEGFQRLHTILGTAGAVDRAAAMVLKEAFEGRRARGAAVS